MIIVPNISSLDFCVYGYVDVDFFLIGETSANSLENVVFST